jgi:hypothetical protein
MLVHQFGSCEEVEEDECQTDKLDKWYNIPRNQQTKVYFPLDVQEKNDHKKYQSCHRNTEYLDQNDKKTKK